MERYHCKSFILVVVLWIFTLSAGAQEKTDSLSVKDVIIRVDGTIIYGKVTEINPTEIKYRLPGVPEGIMVILPRNQVYAISFSDHTNQVITPGFGSTGTAVKTVTTVTSAGTKEKPDTARHNLSYNMAHGALRLALGFSSEYSTFKGMEGYKSTAVTPSFYGAYQFDFNNWLKTGISIGYANLSYKMDESSDYDGLAITQDIKESITTFGLYGRYDILKGFIKPYLLGGLNINYTIANINGDIFFMNEGKHILSTSELNGFKTSLVARAGLDVMITRRFGVYSDIGTGSTLLQVGVIFGTK